MKKFALKFLRTDFEKDQERHVRRVEKIEPNNNNNHQKV